MVEPTAASSGDRLRRDPQITARQKRRLTETPRPTELYSFLKSTTDVIPVSHPLSASAITNSTPTFTTKKFLLLSNSTPGPANRIGNRSRGRWLVQ